MRRFVTHALIFALIQALILVVIWRTCPDDPNHYMAATIDKHARLRAAATPRVIFVGGSSVGFSVDSRAFEPLGLEPVNMGLNDGLGLPFMLAEVAGQLRAGDVVIVAPETHLYWTGSQDDALWAVMQQRPANVACLAAAGPRELANLSDQGLHFLARKLRCAAHQITTNRELPTIYQRDSFDAHGDFAAHRELAPKREQPIDQPWPDPKALSFDRSISALAQFARRCERAGARCFMAWCPTRRHQLQREAAVFAAIEARLDAEVNMPMLERPSEIGFAEPDFFDRGPHLSGDAAAARSARLASALSMALGDDSPQSRTAY
ncbi:hypothetical protein DB30_00949 [Enhygromyxa salina]|uniref:Uncharacterized protein n=1 Tax=Enhygromyxa salina TaxID=215803 RepID=A0A0C2CYF8_9BACT|nr:hypothetical protein [Enhygromyxa salina]KIG12882.1 hypothetical protein DB30_00949 [Enhygromyxa salina]